MPYVVSILIFDFYRVLTRDIDIAILSSCLSVTFRHWLDTSS